jgi:LysM repeat protein
MPRGLDAADAREYAHTTVKPPRALLATTLGALALVGAARRAQAQSGGAEHVYVVAPGDTLSRIASRLEVPPRALAERNYLTRPYALRVGRRLRLPDGVPPEVARRLPTRGQAEQGGAHAADDDTADAASTVRAEESTHRQGFATLVRARDGAVLATNLTAPGQSLRVRAERFLRFRDGSRHPIHPRLLRVLATLSDHFDGRRIVVLSGFRPQLHNTSAPRTRHSQGYAVDLRVEGVALHSVQAYCESIANVGCGLHPHAGFVHVDVRREAASWTDPTPVGGHGRPPPESDETVSEVMADAARVRPARGNE